MKCALIGERLGHSYSKLIHEAFGLYSYELVSLPKDKVGEFMENEEFDAFNVTIPYKRTVMPYCSYISPEAQKIGSVNTVVRTSDGLHGFNTDYFGFKSMAERAGIDFAGKKVVILGSGDIGLIMARRMTLEGAKVLVVAELLPYSGGLKRNIVQCLNDFGIPLKLSHTVVNIEGKERVSGITIAEVGPDRKPIPGTEIHYDCDTLLLSCGLIPENELSRGMGVDISPVTNGPVVDESLQTSIPGVFAAGNVLHVHDLVDYVSEEAAAAGRAAVRYLAQGETAERHEIPVTFEGGIRYTVPASIDPKLVADDLVLRFRVGGVMKKRVVKLLLDDDAVLTRRRPVMAPGEMEELKLTKDMLDAHPGLTRIHITVEEA